MKKVHKIAISTILSLALILFIVIAAWQPCVYAFIVPAILAVVGFSYLIAVLTVKKNEKKRIKSSINA